MKMLTREEKRILLRAKVGNPNLPDNIANRYINGENDNKIDWQDAKDYLANLKAVAK